MIRPRVIPVLLLQGQGLVKTVKFTDPTYLGDPINIVRIFNDKEVDELVFLDITATAESRSPAFETLAKITSECFMPLGYGGGVHTIDDIKKSMKKVKDAGGKVLGEPMEIPDVGHYVSFLDPEGNRVSMLQPIPRNWHSPKPE